MDNYISFANMNSDSSSRSHVNMTFEIFFINIGNDSETMHIKKLVLRNQRELLH